MKKRDGIWISSEIMSDAEAEALLAAKEARKQARREAYLRKHPYHPLPFVKQARVMLQARDGGWWLNTGTRVRGYHPFASQRSVFFSDLESAKAEAAVAVRAYKRQGYDVEQVEQL